MYLGYNVFETNLQYEKYCDSDKMFKMNIATVALYVACVTFIVECNYYLNPVIKTWGRREPNDYRVFYQVVNHEASWIPFSTTSKVVAVPLNSFHSRSAYNTYVSMRKYAQNGTDKLFTLLITAKFSFSLHNFHCCCRPNG